MSNPLLQAKKLSKSFLNSSLFEGIDLEVNRGECVAILGKSGQGKTTLLHLLGLLDHPDEGEIWIEGKKASRWNRSKLRRDHIGFVFQGFHLLEELTPLENLLMVARIRRDGVSSKSQARAKSISLLEEVGLSSRIDTPAKLLSGGEKQRVALARALLYAPPLILADEPTGSLDPENGALILKYLLNLRNEGKGVVIVTHDTKFVGSSDRALYLSNGNLVNFN